ncbi:MAG: cyclic pyranopterin monophosphate synthase MoaC [Candidatus Thorarchaeota archaeon]
MSIDISKKPTVRREATAEGTILLNSTSMKRIKDDSVEKGNIYELAKAAAIHGAKNTPTLLFFCHPIPILGINVVITTEMNIVKITVHVISEGKTGCEMEALTGVSSGLLQIWDMVKMYEKDSDGQYPATRIDSLKVLKKVKKAITNDRK